MEKQANTKWRDVTFQIEDWVLLKLQQYRQTIVAHCVSQKLSKRFFGPFKIIKQVGDFVYMPDLPSSSRIHHVIHVSLFKPYHGEHHATDFHPYHQTHYNI